MGSGGRGWVRSEVGAMLPSLERDFDIEIGVLSRFRILLCPILNAISMDCVGPTPVVVMMCLLCFTR